mgnify:CR=1 FL=1
MEAKFILSKSRLKEQYQKLKDLGLSVSYSYKTNRKVGEVIQEMGELKDVSFSVHAKEELKDIDNKERIWFFTQAESVDELKNIINKDVKNFVVDNEVDLERILRAIEEAKEKINLSIRMKFKEHRIGSGKYFVYGMSSKKVNNIIEKIHNNGYINKLGVHIHRKSQNTAEWEIKRELEDSLSEKNLEIIDFLNFGGGLPVKYRSYTSKVIPYIFSKIKEASVWLKKHNIESIIEPGRFLAAPCIKLKTEIIQVYDSTIVINTTIYNCALDNVLTNTKMILEEETKEDGEGDEYLIKGNSPTRDDIFRYKVKLPKEKAKVGKIITFLNAGAYNYTTDFFGYKKLKTEVVDSF